jgi:EmrB/QacA subfamily drug resistance transporter
MSNGSSASGDVPRVPPPLTTLRYPSRGGTWVIVATALGSGVAFLDATVVNVALPAISEDLDAGVTGLQWTLDAYLVTLTALLLLGGSIGDRYGRRRAFIVGLAAFTAASMLCGIAPNIELLIAARALQGAGAALLIPNSLSLISALFHPDDRGRAVGAWSGLTGVSGAIGPFLGGWLIDAVSWRLVFLINVPLAVLTAWIALRHVPESRSADEVRPDIAGAAAVSIGLAGVAYALIEGAAELSAAEVVVGIVGMLGLLAFLWIEHTSPAPMLPLSVFRSRQFSGANLMTLAVYAGLGGAMFLVVLQLQIVLGYSALEAGTAFLPLTVLMLLFSARVGELSQRIGPRSLMSAGPIVAGAGLLLLAGVGEGSRYLTDVLPAVTVFAIGITLTVAPLTATVLASVDPDHVGVASGTNNAVARLAGLLAVAVLPGLAGIDVGNTQSDALESGFDTAMHISAGLCAVGGVVAWLTIRSACDVTATTQASVLQPCADESVMVHAAGQNPQAGAP